MCSPSEILRGAGKRAAEVKHRARFEAVSRKVQQDPAGYNLWDTPRGRYWIPAGSSPGVARAAGEQYL